MGFLAVDRCACQEADTAWSTTNVEAARGSVRYRYVLLKPLRAFVTVKEPSRCAASLIQ
jgi:hypothetical protein